MSITRATLIGLFIGALVPLGIASPAGAAEQTTVAEPSYLFSIDGGKGSITRAADSTFRLRLAADQVVWFTDRPDRSAGLMSARAFARKWAGYGFTDVPPNAALIVGKRTFVVELSQPRAVNDSLEFTATSIPLERASSGLHRHAKRANPLSAMQFSSGLLFIDDAASCSTDALSTFLAALSAQQAMFTTGVSTLQQAVDNTLTNGITPSPEFESAFSSLLVGIPNWSALSQTSVAGMSAVQQQIERHASLTVFALRSAVQANGSQMSTYLADSLSNFAGTIQATTPGNLAQMSAAVSAAAACQA